MEDSKDSMNNTEIQETQVPSSLDDNNSNGSPNDNNNKTGECEIYTHDTIYSSIKAAEKLGMTYAMVRYYAKRFKTLLPDAINVDQGTLKLSSYDIDVLKHAIELKRQHNYSNSQVIAELSDEEANPLDRPTILTSEEFIKLTQTKGFNDYMKYYTNHMVQAALEQQSELFEEYSAKLDEILRIVSSSSTLEVGDTQTKDEDVHEQHSALEELENRLSEEREKNVILSQELEKERQKPLWKKLFHID
ncbi:MerR family transcriptional regulator (plasmid) [Enterocloster clostridioformis]